MPTYPYFIFLAPVKITIARIDVKSWDIIPISFSYHISSLLGICSYDGAGGWILQVLLVPPDTAIVNVVNLDLTILWLLHLVLWQFQGWLNMPFPLVSPLIIYFQMSPCDLNFSILKVPRDSWYLDRRAGGGLETNSWCSSWEGRDLLLPNLACWEGVELWYVSNLLTSTKLSHWQLTNERKGREGSLHELE